MCGLPYVSQIKEYVNSCIYVLGPISTRGPTPHIGRQALTTGLLEGGGNLFTRLRALQTPHPSQLSQSALVTKRGKPGPGHHRQPQHHVSPRYIKPKTKHRINHHSRRRKPYAHNIGNWRIQYPPILVPVGRMKKVIIREHSPLLAVYQCGSSAARSIFATYQHILTAMLSKTTHAL